MAPTTSQQLSDDRILREFAQLGDSLARWQVALIEGRVMDFEICTEQHCAWIGRLRALASAAAAVQAKKVQGKQEAGFSAHIRAQASELRQRARVFLATVLRMRQAAEVRLQALAGTSQMYALPRAHAKEFSA